MKIYVSTDLEGISGVLNWEQTGRDGKCPAYKEACHFLTQEVNAVIEGALSAGVEQIVVMDGLSRTSAKILAPARAGKLIRQGVINALKRVRDFKPYVIKPPIEVKIEFQNTDVADSYERNGWKRIDGRSVSHTVDSALKIQ